MIEINHLVKKYGDHVAVDDLSLNIESGRIYGFLGPNGAGKSTTMNILTGYLGATSGTVKINGYDIFESPEEAKKCIGYLPELPPVYMDMTVGEYMRFVAELKKLDKDKRKQLIHEAMELTKITDMKDRLIKNLSKGYRQRVGLAQAVLGYPEVIILDEPTVGLDPKQIIEIRELIRTLGEKHTVILSSHILSEISAVCDHVFIISKGKLVVSDTTENLMNMASGGQELVVDVKADEDFATTVLSQVAGVESVQITQTAEQGVIEATIHSNSDTDLREKVFYACAGNSMPIYSMHMGAKSLEDIFLELTTGESTDGTQETDDTVKEAVLEPEDSEAVAVEKEEA